MPQTKDYLSTLAKDYPIRLSSNLLLTAIKIAMDIVAPLMIINGSTAQIEEDQSSAIMYYGIYAGLLVFSQIIPRVQEQLLIAPGNDLGVRLTVDAAEAFFNMPEEIVNQSQGESHEFVKQYTGCMQPGGVAQGMLPVSSDLISGIAELIALNGFMFHKLGKITWPTAIQSIAFTLLVGPLRAGKMGKTISEYIDEFFNGLKRAIRFADGYTTSILFKQQNNEIQKLEEFYRNNLSPSTAKLTQVASNTLIFPAVLSGAALFSQLLWLYWNRLLSANDFILLIFYSGTVTQTTFVLSSRIIQGISSFAALKFLIDYINKGIKPKAQMYDDTRAADITFDNVCFTYPNAKKPIVNDLSFNIKEGQVVALTGENGTGKSTLFKMLFGFIQPDSGSVKLGEQDITELNPDSIRSKCAIVPQKPSIMRGTFSFNISCANPEATELDVAQVMVKVGLSPQFEPNDEIVFGFDGPEISGGQRQRVMIARALLAINSGNINYLFFDEGLASLDTAGEDVVLVSLRDAIKEHNITTVIITHHIKRIQEVMAFDKVIVISASAPAPQTNTMRHRLFQPVEHVIDMQKECKDLNQPQSPAVSSAFGGD